MRVEWNRFERMKKKQYFNGKHSNKSPRSRKLTKKKISAQKMHKLLGKYENPQGGMDHGTGSTGTSN